MKETIIYNWENQPTEYVSSELTLILIIIGAIGYVVNRYRNNKSSWVYTILSLGVNDFFERILSKVLIFISALSLLIISYQNIKEYLYVNHIDKLEEIKETSGIIDNLEFTQRMIDIYSFSVNDIDFIISKRSKYITNRNLLENDSVRIEYFEGKPNHVNTKNVIVKLILLE